MIVGAHFIPKGFDAATLWPLILVRPECRHNTEQQAQEALA